MHVNLYGHGLARSVGGLIFGVTVMTTCGSVASHSYAGVWSLSDDARMPALSWREQVWREVLPRSGYCLTFYPPVSQRSAPKVRAQLHTLLAKQLCLTTCWVSSSAAMHQRCREAGAMLSVVEGLGGWSCRIAGSSRYGTPPSEILSFVSITKSVASTVLSFLVATTADRQRIALSLRCRYSLAGLRKPCHPTSSEEAFIPKGSVLPIEGECPDDACPWLLEEETSNPEQTLASARSTWILRETHSFRLNERGVPYASGGERSLLRKLKLIAEYNLVSKRWVHLSNGKMKTTIKQILYQHPDWLMVIRDPELISEVLEDRSFCRLLRQAGMKRAKSATRNETACETLEQHLGYLLELSVPCDHHSAWMSAKSAFGSIAQQLPRLVMTREACRPSRFSANGLLAMSALAGD